MKTPEAALVLAYWLHMLASTTWIGGLAALTLLILPASSRRLGSSDRAVLLSSLQRSLDRLGWAALIILVFSGLIQMSASTNYQGFLAINNRWAVAILIKHIIFGLIIAISASQTWGVMPGIQRAAFKVSKGLHAPEGPRLEKLNRVLLWANLGLGVIVLGLTALARIS